uniref:PARG_cat domain-containing protein n=1 Tax=Macrostomum lignano TaxID=282301 RepID=A0A1I8JPG2_9PLAT
MTLGAFTCLLLFDLCYIGVALVSLWVERRQRCLAYTFGYERFEVLAVFASLMLAILGVFFVLKECVEGLRTARCHERPGARPRWTSPEIVENPAYNHVIDASTSSWLQEHREPVPSRAGLSKLLLPRLNPLALLGVSSAMCLFLASCLLDAYQSSLADITMAVLAAFVVVVTMAPMAAYCGKILLQSTPAHLVGQLDKALGEAATLDGVLELRKERTWLTGFGQLNGCLQVRVRRDASEQLVLAHVTNRLAHLVPGLTVQVYKDDWSRGLQPPPAGRRLPRRRPSLLGFFISRRFFIATSVSSVDRGVSEANLPDLLLPASFAPPNPFTSHAGVSFMLPPPPPPPPMPPSTSIVMATPVALPTDLANWPKLKRHLEALKRIEPNPEALVKVLDDLHEEYMLNYVSPATGAGSARSFFTGLRRFIEQRMSDEQRKQFFQGLLPFLVDAEPLNYACQQEASVTVLSREFVSSLLSAAFLCVMPQHPKDLAISMSANGFPPSSPPFRKRERFFTDSAPSREAAMRSQLLRTAAAGGPARRQAGLSPAPSLPSKELLTSAKLAASSHPLCRLLVEPEASMKDADTNLLHVCFGNSFLGGGVLLTGVLQPCRQPHPRRRPCSCTTRSLITSMLFVEAMDNNEAVYIMGYEPFSQSDGYGLKMKFTDRLRESLQPDEAGILPRRLVSMDAVPYRGFPAEQYVKQNLLLRDTNKAYVAFRQSYKQCFLDVPSWLPSAPRGVVTGNWGCGAFGGDPQLKSLLQWLVASQLELPVLQYHKFFRFSG